MLHRWTRAALAASLVIALSPAATTRADAAALRVDGLRVDERTDQPLGVDDTTPTFSLALNGTGTLAPVSMFTRSNLPALVMTSSRPSGVNA